MAQDFRIGCRSAKMRGIVVCVESGVLVRCENCVHDRKETLTT